MHVPPKGFVRIRHYGLLCSRTKNKKLTLCRNLLGCKKYLSRIKDKEMPEVLELLYGINICVCKACGGRLGSHSLRFPKGAKYAILSYGFLASTSEVLLLCPQI